MIATTLLIAILSAPATAESPYLDVMLPRPQQVELREGTCPLEVVSNQLQLTTPTTEACAQLRQRLGEALARAGVTVDAPATIGKPGACRLSANLNGSRLGELPKEHRDEGYVLTITPKGLAIDAATERGLFYGIMTLEQLVNAATIWKKDALPCLRIVDWPALKMRGPSEDYGRDQLPTMDDHKRSIRTVAQFKGNTYFWFIEPDHFVYTFDSEMSTEYDRFTLDEIRELVAYARAHYVEVIPVVELLGHMEMTLRHERYRHLSDSGQGGSTLCPTSDEAFEFARRIIDELAPAFGARYFHCGLDESQVSEDGQSAERIKEKGIEAVYAAYYIKLNDAVKAHGQTMIMYTDMVLIHGGILDLLPKDIIMMYWGYTPRPRYNGLDRSAAAGFPTLPLSALWDWNNLYPMYHLGFGNIDTLAAQALDVGSLGLSTSAWGDAFRGACGANLSEWITYGFAYCNAVAWRPMPIPFEGYSPAYALSFFGTDAPELSEALTLLAQCQGKEPGRKGETQAVFQSAPKESIAAFAEADEATMAFWRKVKRDAETAHNLLETVTAPRNDDHLDAIDLAAQTLTCAADMAFLYRDIGKAMGKEDFDAGHFSKALRGIASRHRVLWEEYQRVWRATNRPLNLKRIGAVWTSTRDELSALALEIEVGTFPSP
jgi:hypothetical protein